MGSGGFRVAVRQSPREVNLDFEEPLDKLQRHLEDQADRKFVKFIMSSAGIVLGIAIGESFRTHPICLICSGTVGGFIGSKITIETVRKTLRITKRIFSA